MMAVVSKQLIALLYSGAKPKYSYWNGCSTGGRQGQAMAQRFPGTITEGSLLRCESLK